MSRRWPEGGTTPRPGGEGGGPSEQLGGRVQRVIVSRPLLPAGPASLAGRPGRAAGYL